MYYHGPCIVSICVWRFSPATVPVIRNWTRDWRAARQCQQFQARLSNTVSNSKSPPDSECLSQSVTAVRLPALVIICHWFRSQWQERGSNFNLNIYFLSFEMVHFKSLTARVPRRCPRPGQRLKKAKIENLFYLFWAKIKKVGKGWVLWQRANLEVQRKINYGEECVRKSDLPQQSDWFRLQWGKTLKM